MQDIYSTETVIGNEHKFGRQRQGVRRGCRSQKGKRGRSRVKIRVSKFVEKKCQNLERQHSALPRQQDDSQSLGR